MKKIELGDKILYNIPRFGRPNASPVRVVSALLADRADHLN
jgi:hypothetical protein